MIKGIGHITEGLALRRYDTMIPIIPEPPLPVLDKFEAYMKSLVERQKQMYKEMNGKKPENILLGKFEYERFRRLFRDGPDRYVRELHVKPERFPLTAALSILDADEEDMKARQAQVEEVEKRIPTLLLWGLTVLKSEEHEFHMEVV